MRNQINFFTILFCLFQFTCGRKGEKPVGVDIKPPKVVEAKSFKIPLEKTLPPEVITVSGVKLSIAGKPEIVHLKPNVFTAKAIKTIWAGFPRLRIPNGEKFSAPRVVLAIDSPFMAGRPEVILLDDFSKKEKNSESFSSIKALHGLHSNEISSLCQDKAGSLWIGTWWGGVSKYDGKFLTNYSVAQGLSSDVVSCVMEDKNGNIWIGTTDGGVNKFDGKYITRYTTREGLSDNFINSILQDQAGNIWIATANGLNKYDGRSFFQYTTAQGLPSKIVRGLLEDSKGNLWVGTNGGLTRFDGSVFQNHSIGLGLKATTEVSSLVEGSQGELWFATSNGLYRHDGVYISQFTTEGGLSSNRLSKLTKDVNGNIWIGTWDRGAIKYDGKTFTHLSSEQGLGNEVVPAILQDKQGNIWLATTAGLSKYDGKLFRHIVPIKQEEVECLLADKHGNIWIASGVGNCLNKYNGRSIALYTTAQGLASTAINQMIEDKQGNIWFASRSGVDKYDGKYFTHYGIKNGLIDDVVYCVLEDKSGNLWFGTQNGLSKFDGEVFTNYARAQGLNGPGIFSLLEDHLGNIWIGTSGNGVYSFNGHSFTQYDMVQSLSHPMVLGMMEDENNSIWFCTGMGVNKFDGRYFTWYTTEQGLSNNIVKNVLEDKNGNIWIGTISGINLLRSVQKTSDSKKNTLALLFKKYSVSEGFLGGGTYENSITQDRNGNIWIGATDRVAHYRPEGDTPDTIPPTIQLSRIALFNEEINWQDAEKKKDSTIILTNGTKLKHFDFSGITPWYNQPQNLQLNYDNNYIMFQFIGVTTYRPKEVQYQYFLEGLDHHWSSITKKTEATYNNLPHGKYTFKVKAANSEGYWSEVSSYPFLILPPWWATWWAYLLYATFFINGLWLLTWYRSRQLKAENMLLGDKVDIRTKELEHSLEEKYQLIKKVEGQEALMKERLRISRELHDDIGSTLGSISIYSEVAKNRTAKNQNTNEVLSKIGHASRELIDKMSDIVWSLNSNNESFKQIQNRMIAFSALIFVQRNVLYDFFADEKLNELQFSSEQCRNIFLIFKEAIYNIVKYADCKNVHIRFTQEDGYLSMLIQDDGKGFDVHQVKTNRTSSATEYLGGNGINNMEVRAEEINAKLSIHSTINQGTTVRLTLYV